MMIASSKSLAAACQRRVPASRRAAVITAVAQVPYVPQRKFLDDAPESQFRKGKPNYDIVNAEYLKNKKQVRVHRPVAGCVSVLPSPSLRSAWLFACVELGARQPGGHRRGGRQGAMRAAAGVSAPMGCQWQVTPSHCFWAWCSTC